MPRLSFLRLFSREQLCKGKLNIGFSGNSEHENTISREKEWRQQELNPDLHGHEITVLTTWPSPLSKRFAKLRLDARHAIVVLSKCKSKCRTNIEGGSATNTWQKTLKHRSQFALSFQEGSPSFLSSSFHSNSFLFLSFSFSQVEEKTFV